MGNLATYLQQQFISQTPNKWQCTHEVQLLTDKNRQLLGYSPQVDILLEHENGRRIWIEFEISRADPVANHAKFATAHLIEPQRATDIFLAMFSPDIQKGKRRLGLNMVSVMRRLGMSAFQTTLLPNFTPAEIKRLNHTKIEQLTDEQLPIKHEIARALLVTKQLGTTPSKYIYFVSNLMEVLLNVRQWNQDVASESGFNLWGKRTVTYFIYTPQLELFAPSKFCAYTITPANHEVADHSWDGSTSSVERYITIEHDEPIFDGMRARQHLTKAFGMNPHPLDELPAIKHKFAKWLNDNSKSIQVHPQGAKILTLPNWF